MIYITEKTFKTDRPHDYGLVEYMYNAWQEWQKSLPTEEDLEAWRKREERDAAQRKDMAQYQDLYDDLASRLK